MHIYISIIETMFVDGFLEREEIPIGYVYSRHTLIVFIHTRIHGDTFVRVEKSLFMQGKQCYFLADGRGISSFLRG